MARRRVPVRATMADVAKHAGVSVATVSYVLNGTRGKGIPTRISPETTDRVRASMAAVGYSVNLAARTLRRQRTDRVLLLLNRLSSPFSQSMAQAIGDTLAGHGLSLDVMLGSNSNDLHRAIDQLDRHLADGLIAETGDATLPTLRRAAAGHPIVAVGPTLPEPDLDVVVYDQRPAIMQGLEHLARHQAKRYVLFTTAAKGEMDDRCALANEALTALGIPQDAITIRHLQHDREEAFHDTLTFLPDTSGPVAIYTCSDVSAIGVLWACLRLGRRVPDEVAVLGHGDITESQITFPPLSTVGPVPWDPAVAARFLLSRLENRTLPGRHVLLPWRFVPRRSTSHPREGR